MKRIKGFVAGLTVTLVTAVGLVATLVGTASADVTGIRAGERINIRVPGYNRAIPAGAYVLPDGRPAWCLDPALNGPVGSRFNDPVVAQGWTNADGTAVSKERLAQMAYVMAVYGGDHAASLTANEAAAIYFAIRHLAGYVNTQLPYGYGTGSFQLDDPNSFGSIFATQAGVRDRALQIVDAAITNYSLWDGTATKEMLSAAVLLPGETLSVRWTLPGIRAGKTITVTLTHPDGSTTDHAIVTDSNDQALFEFQIPDDAAGQYSVRAGMDNVTTTKAMAVYPVIIVPRNSSVQALVVGTARVAPWQDSAITTVVDNIEITSVISVADAKPGDTISDFVEITGLNLPGYSFTVAGMIAHLPFGETDWNKATPVHTFDFTIPSSEVTNGTWSSAGIGEWKLPDDASGSYSFGYTLTATPDDVSRMALTSLHELGQLTQTATVAPRVTTGGDIADSSGLFVVLILAAGGLLSGGAAVKMRRRNAAL